MGKKHSFLFTIVLFLFIYTPPIFSWNILHIIAPISYFMLVVKYKQSFRWIMSQKPIRVFIAGSLLSVILLFLTLIFTTKDFLQIYNIIVVLFEVLPISVALALLFHRLGYGLTDVLQILLNVALLQATIAFLMFVNPGFKDKIVDTFYSHFKMDFYTMSYWVQYRVFGFSTGMMFAMPVVQGFLAVVAIMLSIKKSLLYLICVPPLLFTAAINARIGLVVFIIGCLVVFAKVRRIGIAGLFTLFLMLALVLSITPAFLRLIETKSPVTAQWLSDGISDTRDYLRGERRGYFSAFNQMFFIPETNSLLFGKGQNLFSGKYLYDKTSDIGYVNDLFLGGVVFLTILYFSFIMLFKAGRISGNIDYKILAVFMPLTMLVANAKGFAFRQNEFVNLFVFISIFLILSNRFNVSNTKGVSSHLLARKQ